MTIPSLKDSEDVSQIKTLTNNNMLTQNSQKKDFDQFNFDNTGTKQMQKTMDIINQLNKQQKESEEVADEMQKQQLMTLKIEQPTKQKKKDEKKSTTDQAKTETQNQQNDLFQAPAVQLQSNDKQKIESIEQNVDDKNKVDNTVKPPDDKQVEVKQFEDKHPEEENSSDEPVDFNKDKEESKSDSSKQDKAKKDKKKKDKDKDKEKKKKEKDKQKEKEKDKKKKKKEVVSSSEELSTSEPPKPKDKVDKKKYTLEREPIVFQRFKQNNDRKPQDKLLFNLFAAPLLQHIVKNKTKYLSFLDQQPKLHQVINSDFIFRTVSGQNYFESQFNQRIYPYQVQTFSLDIQKPQIVMESYGQPHICIAVCELAKVNQQQKIICISNVYQQDFNSPIVNVNVNVDIQNHQTAFLLIEICGYLNGVSVSIGWTAVSLVCSVDFTKIFSKDSYIVKILQKYSLMDDKGIFANSDWRDDLETMKQKHLQNPFLYKIHQLDIYDGSILQDNCKLMAIKLIARLNEIVAKNIQRLNRMPQNCCINGEMLRILDHCCAFYATQHSGIQTIRLQEVSKANCSVENKNYSKEQITLDTIMTSNEYNVIQKFSKNMNYLQILNECFNKIYLGSERSRREQMKKQDVNGETDRIMIEDFIAVVQVVWNAIECHGDQSVRDVALRQFE